MLTPWRLTDAPATADIDIWVRPAEDNARRVWAALQSFGAPLSKVTPEDFATPEIVYQVGVPPQRIDILTSISGVEFDDAWTDRMIVPVDGLSVPVIGLGQLYANKLASDLAKDQHDATILKELIG